MGKLGIAIVAITLCFYLHTFTTLESNKIKYYFIIYIVYILYIKEMGHIAIQVELVPKNYKYIFYFNTINIWFYRY